MPISQNGWAVQDSSKEMWKIEGVGPVLSGAVWVILNDFVRWFETNIEPLGKSCGSYNRRKIMGSTKWSNHASGTAVDLNWNLHPAWTKNKYEGFTSGQVSKINKAIKKYGGTIRWGASYSDPMHFEIAPGMKSSNLESVATKLLQLRLILRGYSVGKSGADGSQGAATVAALKKYQADNGLKDDALDGPKTWALLNKKL